MSRIDTTSIAIVGNIQVTVPTSTQLMSTYILHEQKDWFEDEIKFIRHIIHPGMKAIDIGANYGLYTLTIANIVGDSGKIWAFEPTEATAACLKESISKNEFNNITLIQSGLSDKIGKARLYTSPNSELNSLNKDASPGDQHETISLLTLDHCKHKYKWEDIDFIKLDAEGEESNILKKGRKALSALSPLIMFELMHGKEVNLPLIKRFKSMGYESYRLVPGLNVLVPFNHNDKHDGYLLNLFCCKEEKAKLLEDEGFLVKGWGEISLIENSPALLFIKGLPYGSLISHMFEGKQVSASEEYMMILNAYILSLSTEMKSCNKVAYLMKSLSAAKVMLDKGEQRIERLVTFARIAFDAGERTLGVKILSDLYGKYNSNIDFELTEPFLPASSRYDHVAPEEDVSNWLFSSIIERLIEKHAFSTYYSKATTLPLFSHLNNLGYMDEKMNERYRLVKECNS